MDNALHYLALNRQIGLAAELDIVANNVANMNTVGFRREGLAFTEYVQAVRGEDSVSMADSGASYPSDFPGVHTQTGGSYDLALEGPGYFHVQHPDGSLLTRAGAFQLSEAGTVTTSSGLPLLDIGGAPIQIPIETKSFLISSDGTVSAGGQALTQIAVVDADPTVMTRVGETGFIVPDGAFEPVAEPKMSQGSLEGSNVEPIFEMSRMIEITRAYEMAQSVIEDEDERVRQAIQTLGETT